LIEFEAVIEEARGGGAGILVPPEVIAGLGGGGRTKVNATFDGVPYRGSVVTYGGRQIIGLLKSIRTEIGKGPGDVVTVTLEVDVAPRSVELPEELAALLAASPRARGRFEALSYSHQREHANHVAEAKRPETRMRRAEKTIESLLRT
jgi:hypothetical protein